ncbi:MAG: hypothetical protein RIS56_1902, partial [Verrucomicrobiota bacterium]
TGLTVQCRASWRTGSRSGPRAVGGGSVRTADRTTWPLSALCGGLRSVCGIYANEPNGRCLRSDSYEVPLDLSAVSHTDGRANVLGGRTIAPGSSPDRQRSGRHVPRIRLCNRCADEVRVCQNRQGAAPTGIAAGRDAGVRQSRGLARAMAWADPGLWKILVEKNTSSASIADR